MFYNEGLKNIFPKAGNRKDINLRHFNKKSSVKAVRHGLIKIKWVTVLLFVAVQFVPHNLILRYRGPG